MEIEGIFGITAFTATMIILTSASIKDWKEREVSDEHWIALGIIGLVVFLSYSVYLTGFRWEYACLAAGTALILLDILSDREFNPFLYYALMAVLFIAPLYHNMSDDIFRAWASIPLCYLIYVGMYFLGVVRGGADVKCLIALSVMFPIYPCFFGLPVIDTPDNPFSQIFVFSISVLFVAAVMTTPLMVYFAARNSKGNAPLGKRFSGYRMAVSQAENANVWPLEDVIDGRLAPIKVPAEEDMGGIYSRLREAGYENVWVTPMIPFIVQITAATALLILVGNPLFLIV